jgi:hypothetical protein
MIQLLRTVCSGVRKHSGTRSTSCQDRRSSSLAAVNADLPAHFCGSLVVKIRSQRLHSKSGWRTRRSRIQISKFYSSHIARALSRAGGLTALWRWTCWIVAPHRSFSRSSTISLRPEVRWFFTKAIRGIQCTSFAECYYDLSGGEIRETSSAALISTNYFPRSASSGCMQFLTTSYLLHSHAL